MAAHQHEAPLYLGPPKPAPTKVNGKRRFARTHVDPIPKAWLANRNNRADASIGGKNHGEVIVTLLTGPNPAYAFAAIGMAIRLKHLKSTRAFMVMVTEKVGGDIIGYLEKAGIRVKLLESIESGGDKPNWIDQLTKLRLWQLVQFTKILFIDADHLIHLDVDQAFGICKKPFCCAEERWGGRADMIVRRQDMKDLLPKGIMCNAGFFILEPSAETFRRMMAEGVQKFQAGKFMVKGSQPGTHHKMHEMKSEQEYLNFFFRDHRQVLGAHFNVPSQNTSPTFLNNYTVLRLDFFPTLPWKKTRTVHCQFWAQPRCLGWALWEKTKVEMADAAGTTFEEAMDKFKFTFKAIEASTARRHTPRPNALHDAPTFKRSSGAEGKRGGGKGRADDTAGVAQGPCAEKQQGGVPRVAVEKPLEHGLFGMVLGYVLETLPYMQAHNVWPHWCIRTKSYGAGFVVPELLELAYKPRAPAAGGGKTFDLKKLRKQVASEASSPLFGNDFKKAHDLFFKFFRMRADVAAAADVLASKLTAPCLGIHYRGSDKQKATYNEATPIEQDEFVVLVKGFLRNKPQVKCLFVATDESSFPAKCRSAFPNLHVVTQDMKRGRGGQRGMHHKRSYNGNAHAKTALVDAIVLSKCKFMLKTSSALSAWSKVFNPELEAYRVQGFNADWFPDASIPMYWAKDDPASQAILKRTLRKDYMQVFNNRGGFTPRVHEKATHGFLGAI